MSGWDLESGKGSSSKMEFTHFPEGITRIRIVDPEPYARWIHWMPQFSRSITCPGRECPICNIRSAQKKTKEPQTYSMSRKFSIHIINRETGKLEIMEQGKTFFDELKEFHLDADIRGYDLKVRRRGKNEETSYRVDKGDVYDLSDVDEKLLDVRVNFADYYKPHTTEQITRLLNGERWEDVMSSNQASSEVVDEALVIA
jgi:hypothetical protein